MKKKADDVLTIKYVALETVRMWDRNAKKHDIQAIIKSLLRHGFKDPVKYEPALNKGAGGIVEGNGRIEALQTMFNQSKKSPPRGIVVQDGKWLVPVLFGVDSESQSAAESYGIDHNNITMMGGGYDPGEVMRMWGQQAVAVMADLKKDGQMPISISAEDLDAMLDEERETLPEREEFVREKNMLRILISVPVSVAIDAQPHIDKIKEIPGVEVDITGN